MAIQSSSAQSHEQKLTSKRVCGEPRPRLSKNGWISWQAVQGSAYPAPNKKIRESRRAIATGRLQRENSRRAGRVHSAKRPGAVRGLETCEGQLKESPALRR